MMASPYADAGGGETLDLLSILPSALPPLHICSTPIEAANAILQHSFAIVRLSSVTASSLDRSWRAARQFFSATKQQQLTSKAAIQRYHRIVNNNLLGYNVPSEAKVLYRCICSDWASDQIPTAAAAAGTTAAAAAGTEYEKTADCNGINAIAGSTDQPWPDDVDGGDLRQASMNVASKLHLLLVECLDEIRNVCKCKSNDDDLYLGKDWQKDFRSSSGGDDRGMLTPPLRKRRRLVSNGGTCSANDSGRNVANCGGVAVMQNRNTCNANRRERMSADRELGDNTFCVPRTMNEAKYCPLDYFLYHGNNNDGGKPTTNCSEHIDRGVLICVSLTDVPGLEVLPRNQQQFVCPEMLSRHEAFFRDRSSGVSDMVCIMAGDQLRDAVSADVATEGKRSTGRRSNDCVSTSILRPCVHRVKSELERARLSVTYELREGIISRQ